MPEAAGYRDLTARLETACLPIMEEWLEDLGSLGVAELQAVPEDSLRICAFMLVRRVVEHVAREMGAEVTLDGGREDFKALFHRAACVMVDAIDDQVPYTRGRSGRVAEYSGRLASMLGLTDEEIADIEFAARIHNIGLVNTSQRLLRMPRKLSAEELSMARNHSQVGADIMRPIEFLAQIVPMVRCHHAHWDGSGFPPGLEGEQIPIGARIIAMADAFEAMCSERPHRPAMTRQEALGEIQKQAKKQFDPKLVAIANVLV
ncbi:MAG: HD domain-containing protein [Fimbriimonadaceae bacterium]|nr:HD domain-containing protein [Fimbriimonadaceae bacterium]